MDLLFLVDWLGDTAVTTIFGLLTGIIFGVAAQRSTFCLRAATAEFAHFKIGPRLSIWLLTFSTALAWVQGARLLGLFRPEDARMMAIPGSWSGAIVGGLMFGVGMILARGCSGRLLVLASTGNLRSLVSGLVFAVVAQMSLGGILAPARDLIAGLWITSGGRNVDLLDAFHLPEWGGFAIGVAIAIYAIWISLKNQLGVRRLVFASGVGFAVAFGWIATYNLAQVSFETMQIKSATFTGPSANVLMFVLNSPRVFEFDIGLVPGVVIGAFFAALFAGELEFQGYEGARPMQRAITGAVLMGFGGMLAGGCAIGAGVTGGSIFAGTAWLALTCMWIGAVATERLLNLGAPGALPGTAH